MDEVTMTSLSDAARSVWAKYDHKADVWLPLHRHLTDSAAIAEILWDNWISQHTREQITDGRDPSVARSLAIWVAATHDIGKASPGFAFQVEPLTGRMRDAGLLIPANTFGKGTSGKVQHSVLGFSLIKEWLIDSFQYSPRVADSVASVAGGHHGVPPNRDDLRAVQRGRGVLLGSVSAWDEVRRELFHYVTRYCTAENALSSLQDIPLGIPAQALLTGFVIVADWLASNSDYFAYNDPRDSKARAAEAWQRLELPPPWQATAPDEHTDTLVIQRFSLGSAARARPVQRTAVEAARALENGLLIIEAPMGEGKTEAALLAAEILAASTGAGGCFFALPTMATSDALFGRILSWVDHLPDNKGRTLPQSMFLAHSKAHLNADFNRIRGIQGISDGSAAEAHQWLVGRKKGVLANFVVGTIDQILFSALKMKHLVLRQLGLAAKVVVIDEVHTADAYMSVYLERALAWLGAYRVPVILLSATLAPSARTRLASAYHSLTADDSAAVSENTSYPLITAVSAHTGRASVTAVEKSSRSTRITVDSVNDDLHTLIDHLRPAVEQGAAVAVIRNTVARAQATAQALREAFGADRVLLVHSRMIAVDRVEREMLLRERLGPQSRTRGPFIVVGTQVLEQSLDIDVDLMVSDIAPMDLLLQRAGRLHRHDRAGRPASCATARLLITGVTVSSAAPPEFDSGALAVYGRALLMRTVAQLARQQALRTTVCLPADVSELVRTVYDDVPPPPADWEEAWDDAEAEWNSFLRTKKHRAATFLLRHPNEMGSSLVDWLKDMPFDTNEESPRGQQEVRDSDEAIEVLVAQRRGDDIHVLAWLPGSESAIPTQSRPSEDAAWTLATSALRLPRQLCQWYEIEKTIGALEINGFEGWQQSHLLKGQLVLVLDDNLEAEVGRFLLRYDREDGLVIFPHNTRRDQI
ncbi:CRISPR-associated helicase Cas3' [Rathayibacter toxicus]|uniref:CRISPR-associated helicase Cas3' n=1 Tax=Rathayibacter toxicus TaxID=145458 RepID=UPI001C04402C|nr:CRISPR-associated helicase Cas3' [Rathayibacter toxicus]QWL29403.1 CRISPR-associated helicase Cas3' [Rathayibacter toxicus]